MNKVTKYILFLLICQSILSCKDNEQNQFQFIEKNEETDIVFKYDGSIYNFKLSDSLRFLSEYGVLSDDETLFTNFKYNPNGTLKSLKYSNKEVSVSQDFDNRVIKEQIAKSDNDTEITSVIKQQDVKHQSVYYDNREIYFAIYENNQKTYNTFKLIEVEKKKNDKTVISFLRNDFPFNGDLKFSTGEFDYPLLVKRRSNNEYELKCEIGDEKINELILDIEILPSENDTCLNSVYAQVFRF